MTNKDCSVGFIGTARLATRQTSCGMSCDLWPCTADDKQHRGVSMCGSTRKNGCRHYMKEEFPFIKTWTYWGDSTAQVLCQETQKSFTAVWPGRSAQKWNRLPDSAAETKVLFSWTGSLKISGTTDHCDRIRECSCLELVLFHSWQLGQTDCCHACLDMTYGWLCKWIKPPWRYIRRGLKLVRVFLWFPHIFFMTHEYVTIVHICQRGNQEFNV